ncbi:MAG: TPM domain-containing protein [Microbacter sp.]
MASQNPFFTQVEQELIQHAIVEAESNTSGEIRVHVESFCKGDPMKRALFLFHTLGMNKTRHHNGVLFYIAMKSHKLAIIGDKAIHEKVSQSFWNQLKEHLVQSFAKNRYTEALVEAILKTGIELKKAFPHESSDQNELPDEISFGS